MHLARVSVVAIVLGFVPLGFGASMDDFISWFVKTGILFHEEALFTISYSEGYNINFEISHREAKNLLPDTIEPIKLRIVDSDSDERYYLSLYFAGMESQDSIERIDVFTYGMDQKGGRTLYFLSSIMEIPKKYQQNPMTVSILKKVLNYLARDSRTGKPSYPHYFADSIDTDHRTFRLKYHHAEMELENCPSMKEARFSRMFILANSQIYRNDKDKNTNYFNQSFIDAKVEIRDPSCLNLHGLEIIHPLLLRERLRSVQFYGSQEKQIRWYFEM